MRQGPARRSHSRSTTWAARSCAVQPSSSVGASAPSASKRSQSARRSCASNGRFSISVWCQHDSDNYRLSSGRGTSAASSRTPTRGRWRGLSHALRSVCAGRSCPRSHTAVGQATLGSRWTCPTLGARCASRRPATRDHLPTYSSWLNWIESEFAALRYFALNGTDQPQSRRTGRRHRRPISAGNQHAEPQRGFGVDSKIRLVRRLTPGRLLSAAFTTVVER